MKNKKGFTLIEIIVVVIIIGILAVLAFSNVFNIFGKSKIQILDAEASKIKEAAAIYVEDYCDNPIGDNKCSDTYSDTLAYEYKIENETKETLGRYICISTLYDKNIIDEVYYDENLCSGFVLYDEDGKNSETYLYCGNDVKNSAWDNIDLVSGYFTTCIDEYESDIKITIKLDANNGYLKDKDGNNVETLDVKIGELNEDEELIYGALPIPQREGYAFKGWYKEREKENNPVNKETIVNDKKYHTLYAHWESRANFTYTGSFDCNGEILNNTSCSISVKEWYVKFLTSGTLTVNSISSKVDIFLVGGGAGGNASYINNYTYGSIGSGGGGGQIIMDDNIYIGSNKTYEITIGAGGKAGSSAYGYTDDRSLGGNGGETNIIGENLSYKAIGGNGCKKRGATGGTSVNADGSGAGGKQGVTGCDQWGCHYTKGKDGLPGKYAFNDSSFDEIIYGSGGGGGGQSASASHCGVGGSIYAGNGGVPGTNGVKNTGSGGGGGSGWSSGVDSYWENHNNNGGQGGSGIIIIRDTKTKYTATYHTNSTETNDNTNKYSYGFEMESIEIPIKTGYTFDGYYTEENGNGTKYFDKNGKTTVSYYNVQDDIDLYANWIANTYTITLNSNDNVIDSCTGWKRTNSNKKATKSITFDTTYGTLPTITKTGYTFVGWYSDSNYENKITEDLIFNTPNNITLYAKIIPTTYTITFNANGGVSTLSQKTVDYASTYGELPTATKVGYIFDGWYLDSTKINFGTIFKKTKNITLLAHWTAIKYSIIYDGNTSTSGTMSNSTHTYDKSQALSGNSYKKTGYTFKGWNNDKAKADAKEIKFQNQEKVINLSSIQGDSITLYAIWTANSYTITLDAKSGIITESDDWTNTKDNTKSTKKLTYDSIYGNFPNVSRIGYTFNGWYTDDKYTNIINSSSIVKTAANSTLYAKWTANTYNITYELNGGTFGTNHPDTATYGKEFTVNKPTKTGYKFNGWNITTDNNSLLYENTNETKYKNLTSDNNANILFTANWTKS